MFPSVLGSSGGGSSNHAAGMFPAVSPSPGASTSFAHALAMAGNAPHAHSGLSHSGNLNPMMMHHLQANQPLALHPHMHQGSGHIATSFGYAGSGGNTPGSGSGGISTLISAIPSRTGSPRREHIQGTNGGNNPGGLSPYSPNGGGGAGGSPNGISPSGSGGAVAATHMMRSNSGSLAAMALGRGSPGSVPSGSLGGRDAPRNSIAIPMSPNGLGVGVGGMNGLGVGVGVGVGSSGPVVGVPGVVAVGAAQVRHVSPSRALVSPLPSQGISTQTYHAAQAQLAHAQSQAHASMLHSIARNVTGGSSPQPGFNRLSPGMTNGTGGPTGGSTTATVVKRRTSLAPNGGAVVGSAPAVVGMLGGGGAQQNLMGGYPVQAMTMQQQQSLMMQQQQQQQQQQQGVHLPPATANGTRQGSLGRVSREFDETDESQQTQAQGPLTSPAPLSNSMPLGSYQAHQPAHVHIPLQPTPHHLVPLARSPSSMLLPPNSAGAAEAGSAGSPQNVRFSSNSAPGSSGGGGGATFDPSGLQAPDRTLSPTPNQLQPLSRSHPLSNSTPIPAPATGVATAAGPAAGLSLTLSADDALAAAVAASFTEGLSPSANITPSSSSHRRICSLPLYVSARKPRAYKSHITYSASGGIMKENSIGIGVGQAPPLTVAPGGVLMPLSPAPLPMAAAAAAQAAAAGASSAALPAVAGGFTPLLPLSSETSLIDSEAGYTFVPQRHTQAFKSHFQKKSHQAVFALFAAIDPPGGPGSGQMPPVQPLQQHGQSQHWNHGSFGSAASIATTGSSSAPTPMPLSPSSIAHLPAGADGPLSAGGQSTDEDSALEAWLGAGGSLESGPRSPHSPGTAAALLASALALSQSGPTDVGKFYAQFFRAHFIEMMETHYPSASANPAAAPGGGLSAEESKVALHGIVQLTIRAMEQECLRAHPAVCITGAGCAFCVLLISGGVLYTYNSFFISQDPRFPSTTTGSASAPASGAVVPAPSPLSAGAQQQAKEAPPLAPFHAMLCRQGRGIDLSIPESVAASQSQMALPMPMLPPASPATVAAWRGGGVDQVAERMLMQGDEFVLLSSLPLSRQTAAVGLPPADGSHPLPPSAASIGAAVASAPFPDVASMCHFVSHSPTPQETVTRIVDAHTRATATVPGPGPAAEKRPNLIMTLVYF